MRRNISLYVYQKTSRITDLWLNEELEVSVYVCVSKHIVSAPEEYLSRKTETTQYYVLMSIHPLKYDVDMNGVAAML